MDESINIAIPRPVTTNKVTMEKGVLVGDWKNIGAALSIPQVSLLPPADIKRNDYLVRKVEEYKQRKKTKGFPREVKVIPELKPVQIPSTTEDQPEREELYPRSQYPFGIPQIIAENYSPLDLPKGEVQEPSIRESNDDNTLAPGQDKVPQETSDGALNPDKDLRNAYLTIATQLQKNGQIEKDQILSELSLEALETVVRDTFKPPDKVSPPPTPQSTVGLEPQNESTPAIPASRSSEELPVVEAESKETTLSDLYGGFNDVIIQFDKATKALDSYLNGKSEAQVQDEQEYKQLLEQKNLTTEAYKASASYLSIVEDPILHQILNLGVGDLSNSTKSEEYYNNFRFYVLLYYAGKLGGSPTQTRENMLSQSLNDLNSELKNKADYKVVTLIELLEKHEPFLNKPTSKLSNVPSPV